MHTKYTLILLAIIATTIVAKAQDVGREKNAPLSFETKYTGDGVQNFSGGISKGSAYLGMANIKVGFDTEKAGLWKGGTLFINGANTHGGTPSATYIGDAQVASNIEAGEHSYFHEFWYRQQLGQFQLTLGIQDLNVEFMASRYASELINSSFGVPYVIPANLPAPIFPFTSLGFIAKWIPSEKFAWQLAVFNSPTDFTTNPHNLFWKANDNDGLMLFNEFQYSTTLKNGLSGTYKLGAYYHDHHIIGDGYEGNYGVFLVADHELWKKADNSQSLGAFAQLAFNPKTQSNACYYYFGGGLSYQGLFKRLENDVLALAVNHAGLDTAPSETVVELSYKAQLTENIFVQPDIQYIFNPMGTGTALPNATVSILRFGLQF